MATKIAIIASDGSAAASLRFDALAEDLRSDAGELDDPRAQALFETSAEVVIGLRAAFAHFEKRSEAAWRGDEEEPTGAG